jgi:nitrogen fixation NifU-like protein
MADLNELYQRIILDHNKAPRNFRLLPDANRSGEGNNPSCGDRFTIFATIENERVRELSFQGSGCAISKASASIMTESVFDKTIGETKALFEQFSEIVHTGSGEKNISEELEAFATLRKFPMRAKCALLPWNALMNALKTDLESSKNR